MKKFTNLYENYFEANPGNELYKTSITNHYTPIQNILNNINNLFCSRLSIVATVAEDNLSIKLTSSKFGTEKNVDDLLYMPLYNDVNYQQSTLAAYLMAQGLDKMTKINIGGYYIVYFSPSDMKTVLNTPIDTTADATFGDTDKKSEPKKQQKPKKDSKKQVKENCPCPVEFQTSLLNEFEMSGFITEDDEEEMKSATVEKVLELLDGPDKVKAAKQLELLVANEIQLPREFYFAAVKFKSGEEAIALRWKYTKKMPFGKSEGDNEGYKEITVENTRSIMHIFGKGEQTIWVQDYDKEALVKLPDEVKKLIDNILDLLEAGKTDNPAIFKLTGERQERETDDENKDEDKDNDKKKNDEDDDNLLGDDDKNKKDESDDEDDESRGDKSDDLL